MSEQTEFETDRLDTKIGHLRAALQFIADLADEELAFAKVGTGAEVALRHISRRAHENLDS